jgi:hypothetical protein
MKVITLIFFSFYIFTSSTFNKKTEEIKYITYGTDFCSGKCDGYCLKEKKYNSKYLITKEAYCKNDSQKNKIDTTIMTDKRWTNVCHYVEIEKFFKVPEITGCPGCSDGGIEWIEIVTSKRTRKIKFEYDHYIKEIGGLLVILRNRK